VTAFATGLDHPGLLDGIEFKQTTYALDRFLKRALGGDQEPIEEDCHLAA